MTPWEAVVVAGLATWGVFAFGRVVVRHCHGIAAAADLGTTQPWPTRQQATDLENRLARQPRPALELVYFHRQLDAPDYFLKPDMDPPRLRVINGGRANG